MGTVNSSITAGGIGWQGAYPADAVEMLVAPPLDLTAALQKALGLALEFGA